MKLPLHITADKRENKEFPSATSFIRKSIIILFFLSIILLADYHTIYDIQGQQSSSPYANQVVTTSGVVTGVGISGFFLQEKNSNPAWRGIYVYTQSNPNVSIGDSIVVTDSVKEYFGLTEIKSPQKNYSKISSTTTPEPVILKTDSVSDEKWECVLVKVEDAVCVNPNAGNGEWIVNDGSGDLRIDDLLFSYSPLAGVKYTITGPVYFSTNFKIEPRGVFDIASAPKVYNVLRYPPSPTFLDRPIIKAKIIDDGQIIADSIIYRINSGSYSAKSHDSISSGYYYYNIPKRNKGDTIFYYVKGIDNSLNKDSSMTFSYVVRDTTDTQFRVMTYNILNFPGSTPQRLGYMMKVFRQIVPDILIIQELNSASGADMILDSLNTITGDYARAEFIQDPNDPSSNNMLFYRTSLAYLLSQDTICTSLRNINEYVMEINNNIIRFYSCHLKANDDDASINQRLEEVTKLRNHLSTLPESSEFIIAGDMNFYTSTEPGYQKFIADEENDIGRARDLLGVATNWHDNSSCAIYHTQSTRTGNIGDGGSTGGLDDRFDFIFGNYNINDNRGIEYVLNTYKAYGNDGNHFNQSINYGTNDSVPQEIADALYYGSDHLPVIAEFIALKRTGVEEGKDMYDSLFVEMIPNGLKIKGVKGDRIYIYDIAGRLIDDLLIDKETLFIRMRQGIYFLRSGKFKNIKKVIVF